MTGRSKRELRAEMRTVVGNLDPRWIRAASGELCTHLVVLIDRIEGVEVRNILAWIPYFSGEIDLSGFIAAQLNKRAIFLPRVLPDRSMKFISLGSDWSTTLQPGYFGIPEPGGASGEFFELEEAASSVIIMPGMAFDREGRRLGRGAGYYDRFLASHPALKSIFKIGVCWSLQLVPELWHESHDVGVDWVCHERGFFRAGSVEEAVSDV